MGSAREYVRSRLGEVLPASKLGEIELMTTELVTNAIEHAPGGNEVGLEIDIRSESVRVSIIDAGSGFDPPRSSGLVRWGVGACASWIRSRTVGGSTGILTGFGSRSTATSLNVFAKT